MRALRRVGQGLLADRQKLSIMLGLLAVALLLWGRVLLKRVPRTAMATPPTPAASTDAGKSDSAESPLKQLSQVVYVDLGAALRRDLFAIDIQRFAQVPVVPKDSITQEKLPPKRADESDAAHLATGLRVQSTVLGQEPRAIINGSPVTVGQEFRGFRIKNILDRQVIVERNGEVFILKM